MWIVLDTAVVETVAAAVVFTATAAVQGKPVSANLKNRRMIRQLQKN